MVDLDAIERMYERAMGTMALVPDLIAELREARAKLAKLPGHCRSDACQRRVSPDSRLGHKEDWADILDESAKPLTEDELCDLIFRGKLLSEVKSQYVGDPFLRAMNDFKRLRDWVRGRRKIACSACGGPLDKKTHAMAVSALRDTPEITMPACFACVQADGRPAGKL